MIIWVTGISAAGKTTLCSAIRGLLKPRVPELVVLDGDVVRAAFGNDLTHTEEDRVVQVNRLQSMAKVLEAQGIVVLVGVLYSHPELLAWNRDNFEEYFEVYLRITVDAAAARDPKGLYAMARAGDMPNVVGIDIPWHEPERPDLVVDQENPDEPDVEARRIIETIPRFRDILG
ncbi:MAG: adenylyl-sulfate kinase [Pseudomonadota bacterium]|nr:adenylyl-sulfate kinase [Pseudomonadota bacterium]